MAVLLLWLMFALVVAVAASSRGRNGLGWFVLAVVISPLIALLLVLVMPDRRQKAIAAATPPPLAPGQGWGRQITTVRREPAPEAFPADGLYAGIPYRVTASGSIEAIIQGARIAFVDMDRFIAAAGRPDVST